MQTIEQMQKRIAELEGELAAKNAARKHKPRIKASIGLRWYKPRKESRLVARRLSMQACGVSGAEYHVDMATWK
jgi:hypothetical protein